MALNLKPGDIAVVTDAYPVWAWKLSGVEPGQFVQINHVAPDGTWYTTTELGGFDARELRRASPEEEALWRLGGTSAPTDVGQGEGETP